MNSVISFDKVAEAKSILRAGIDAKSIRARNELRTVAWYLINKTSYTSKQVEARLRTVASDYFKGMSEDFVNKSISDIIVSAKSEQWRGNADNTPSPIIIYRDELGEIEKLGHDDVERLAFVFLCVAKMVPYKQIYECNAELYRLAWKYRYDTEAKKVIKKQEGRRVGGSEPTKRVNLLCRAGIVRYTIRINTPYWQAKDKSPASATFSVPILQNNGDIAFIIDKPDEESLVLYYDRYKEYGGIITCKQCGKPVIRTGRRQKYCNVCADIINHHPEKRDLSSAYEI